MTRPLDETIPALARILSGPEDTALTLTRRNGAVEIHRRIPSLSRHRELALMPLVAEIEAMMNDLPVLRGVTGDWTFAAKFDKPVDRKTRQASFRIRILEFDISRIASPSAKISAEVLAEARERLARVERDTAAEDGPVRRWLVSCRDRQGMNFLARSARQAAWTYAALCNRSRKETAAWRETPEQILSIFQIHPDEEWRAPGP